MPIKTQTAVGLGFLAVLGYSLFRKGAALGNLHFFPYNIKNVRMQGLTPIITMGLAIQNPNNQSFTLKNIFGELYANGYLIGNVSVSYPQTIAANSEQIVYIEARMLLISIVNDILNAIKTGTWSQTLELEATANVDNLVIPLNIKYKFA